MISSDITPPSPSETTAPVYAALDLGSNSFHLIIARFEAGKMIILDSQKETVRLASGLRSDGILSKNTIKRALASIHRFAERLQAAHITQFRVVGTNTLRAAKNADGFLERAEEILQSPIDIISGTEEARIIYLGIANDFAPTDKKRLIVDIGGGSTELVVGLKKPENLQSIHMGCVTYSQRYFEDGMITRKAFDKALLAARSEIQEFVNQFSSKRWQEAVGSSGTIRAIESVLEGLSLNNEHVITLDGLSTLANKLCEFDCVEKLNLPNLNDDRKAVFPGGLAVLLGLFIELKIEQMHVSSYALREGIIFELAGRKTSADIREQTVQQMMKQYYCDEQQSKRITEFASKMLEQTKNDFEQYDQSLQTLRWALSLHEIGLAISYSGYHKHGAYILLNCDMPGFSKREQILLSFIVLNHRRKLRPLPQTYGFEPDWRLVQIARVAWLFCRRRDDNVLPTFINISFKGDTLKLALKEQWLLDNPLIEEDLLNEQNFLEQLNLTLQIKRLSDDN